MILPTHNIYDLVNPNNFSDDLIIDKKEPQELVTMLESMLRIRLTEQKLALEKKANNIGGPVHLGAGQEAIAVGIAKSLNKKDKIFGAHRSHAHIISMTNNIHKLFAEVLGKDTGYSKGMGGSMHLWDRGNGFYGSVPIVAGTVSLAVGAGIASRLMKDNSVSVSYLGDGAVEEGVVFESFNLAKVHRSPTVFVIENNLFSSHMHISQRQPSFLTKRIGDACGIRSVLLDGNNVVEIQDAASELIKFARDNCEPVLIEAITYRFFGHVDWRDDIDVGVNRSQKDLELWKLRDPISRLSNALHRESIIDKDYIKSMQESLNDEINKAWNQALLDPYPAEDQLLGRVYAKK